MNFQPHPGRHWPSGDKHALRAKSRRGFTMIELLMVLGIIGLLSAMAMSILRIADRAARRSASQSMMAKVDSALRLFRAEIGSYPFQRSYPDISTATPDEPKWSNRLFYHLGGPISSSDLTNVLADVKTAAAHYEINYVNCGNNWGYFVYPDNLAIQQGDGWYMQSGGTIILNRLAAERARLMIFAGNVDGSGVVYPTGQYPGAPNGWPRRRPPTNIPLVPTANLASAHRPDVPDVPDVLGVPGIPGDHPGWAGDYLSGQVEKRYRSGNTILDGWQRPLIYVCQVVEGMTTFAVRNFAGDNECYGFDLSLWGLERTGRQTLGPIDALTRVLLTNNTTTAATGLPDKTNLRHSDRRYWAAPGCEADFELWSAGPNGQADWMRDALVNRDNIPSSPYDRTLP